MSSVTFIIEESRQFYIPLVGPTLAALTKSYVFYFHDNVCRHSTYVTTCVLHRFGRYQMKSVARALDIIRTLGEQDELEQVLQQQVM